MDPLQLLLLFAVALAPPVILSYRLRNAERYRPEPYRVLAQAFAWGAFLAAAIAIVAQYALLKYFGASWFFDARLTIMVVLVAPIVEELAKALGLRLIRDDHPEPEDGYIYGGAVGLGFAATENAIYIMYALALAGEDSAIATALYRGVATVALHGAASAVAGHGIWRARYGGPVAKRGADVAAATWGHSWWALWGIAAAIGLHIAYNALSALSLPWATLLAAGVAVVAYLRMMVRVRALDETGTPP